ncbi:MULTISPECIES: hypothetical protein [Ramlibacter]|uniref:Uncharacterized protein n=1 Tax=Ramlibacter pinisoli TaxID=2682844 RepID=A0A6N8J1Z6_9BURK|nr:MULTISPECIES: hypothetical protein [Ramlibacter]MBA2962264.1 hypothetical protein [Ramlibacter sp. CGMCC 1.13660]MVQ32206.1 hypothetical protein [Ramlibacter pinisoli]
MKCTCIVKNAYVVRIPRTWWMRLLPFSKHYHCTHCEAKFLRFTEVRHDYGVRVSLDSSHDDSTLTQPLVRKRVRAGTGSRARSG